MLNCFPMLANVGKILQKGSGVLLVIASSRNPHHPVLQPVLQLLPAHLTDQESRTAVSWDLCLANALLLPSDDTALALPPSHIIWAVTVPNNSDRNPWIRVGACRNSTTTIVQKLYKICPQMDQKVKINSTPFWDFWLGFWILERAQENYHQAIWRRLCVPSRRWQALQPV